MSRRLHAAIGPHSDHDLDKHAVSQRGRRVQKRMRRALSGRARAIETRETRKLATEA